MEPTIFFHELFFSILFCCCRFDDDEKFPFDFVFPATDAIAAVDVDIGVDVDIF